MFTTSTSTSPNPNRKSIVKNRTICNDVIVHRLDYEDTYDIPDNLIEWRQRTFAPKPKFIQSAPPPRATGKKTSTTMTLNIGDRVAHDTFGLGTVVKISGEGDRTEATINFGQLGEKRLLLRYAPVEKL